jgi:hypothetical protein
VERTAEEFRRQPTEKSGKVSLAAALSLGFLENAAVLLCFKTLGSDY